MRAMRHRVPLIMGLMLVGCASTSTSEQPSASPPIAPAPVSTSSTSSTSASPVASHESLSAAPPAAGRAWSCPALQGLVDAAPNDPAKALPTDPAKALARARAASTACTQFMSEVAAYPEFDEWYVYGLDASIGKGLPQPPPASHPGVGPALQRAQAAASWLSSHSFPVKDSAWNNWPPDTDGVLLSGQVRNQCGADDVWFR